MIKIGFVIAASVESPWSEIHKQGQKKTWLMELDKADSWIAAYSSGEVGESWINPNKHWKLQYGSKLNAGHVISDPDFFESNGAFCKGVSGYGSLVGTSFSAISYLLKNHQCDYVVRTNVSSYWNVHALRDFLEFSKGEISYSGKNVKLFRHIRGLYRHDVYASGAGIIMRADVANKFVEHSKRVPKNIIDDMAIGKLAFKLGVKCTDLPRIDINQLSDVEELTEYQLKTNFHYRCKSYSKNEGLSSRGDAQIMQRIHKKIKGNGER